MLLLAFQQACPDAEQARTCVTAGGHAATGNPFANSMEPLYVAWTKPEALLEAIHQYHNDHPEATICRVACLSIGYEGFEHMIEQFVADHRPIEGLQVEIDIHYRWKADLWRRLGE